MDEPEAGASRAGLQVRHPPGRPAGRSRAPEDVVARWSRPRLPIARALAADGKRIRAASRNGEGRHGTVAPAGHASGAPFALPDFGDEGGELAATHDLLERSDIRGKVIALDALHTTRKTAKPVTERADYVFTVKSNAPETFGILDGIDRERDAAGRFEEDVEKARGRLERRSVRVTTPPKGAISHPGGQPGRPRHPLPGAAEEGCRRRGREGPHRDRLSRHLSRCEGRVAGGSASADRGHRVVENLNHRQRDRVFGEDACPTRTGYGPANRASLNNIALAVIFAWGRPQAAAATRPQRSRRGPDPALRGSRIPAVPGRRRKGPGS